MLQGPSSCCGLMGCCGHTEAPSHPILASLCRRNRAARRGTARTILLTDNRKEKIKLTHSFSAVKALLVTTGNAQTQETPKPSDTGCLWAEGSSPGCHCPHIGGVSNLLGPMVLRRGWTLISSHFPNALADGSRGHGALSVSGHKRWAEKFRGEGKAGCRSHPLPWGGWSIPGQRHHPVCTSTGTLLGPGTVRDHLPQHLLVHNQGGTAGGLHSETPEAGTESAKPLMKRQRFSSAGVAALWPQVWESTGKDPTPGSCCQHQPTQLAPGA